jgi:ATP-dependent Lon protease
MLQQQKKELGRFHAPVLFFVGLAGTGKTTFARSIAEALGRQFARIPFGGLSSALDLRGMSKVQPEAEPGQILKALRRVGTKNPVILLDELDRIAPSAQGEIMGVLLELLDPEQNGHFIDHYVDYPFDLSEVIFVATANNTRSISTAVLDRLEIIQMPSYTDEEKIHIASHYLLPRLLNDSGMAPDALQVEDPVWKHVARLSGYDPGIRSVERKVESMVRNAAFRTVTGKGQKFVISEGNAKEFIEE